MARLLPRDPQTGAWTWSWLARPDSSYTEWPENEIVAVWRDLVGQLVDERLARGLGLRRVARAAGLSLSVVNGLEQGNTWPRVRTAERVADALGFDLEVAQEPGYPVVEGVMRQVRRQRRDDEMTPRKIAEYAGIRPSTYYELPQAIQGGSILTVLVLAHQVAATITLKARPLVRA